MSDKLPVEPQSEEVDLGQLFNAIGRLFERLFNFIGSIFKGIFSIIIYAIKPFVTNFKIVAPVLVLAVIAGFSFDKMKKPVYKSKMIVRPHFDSKYQLANNIDYFNYLIGSKNIEELSNIFEIDSLKVSQLLGFELEAGPETQNDLFKEYDEYVMSVDTSLVDELSYENFIKDRELLSSKVFTIEAKALKDNVFSLLEEGFRKTFENEFSKNQKAIRDTLAYIERESLMKELSSLDSIQKTYLEVIREEAKNGKITLGLDGLLPLQEEKTQTKEYELFKDEQGIRRSIQVLNKEIAEENTYFDVLSTFDKVGSEDKSIKRRYLFVLPVLVILAMFLAFFSLRVFNFIKDYE